LKLVSLFPFFQYLLLSLAPVVHCFVYVALRIALAVLGDHVIMNIVTAPIVLN